jgi:hypothetical protein
MFIEDFFVLEAITWHRTIGGTSSTIVAKGVILNVLTEEVLAV